MWKQARYEEAKELAGEMREMIEGMEDSKFAKYQEEERQMLGDMMRDLEQWRESGGK